MALAVSLAILAYRVQQCANRVKRRLRHHPIWILNRVIPPLLPPRFVGANPSPNKKYRRGARDENEPPIFWVGSFDWEPVVVPRRSPHLNAVE